MYTIPVLLAFISLALSPIPSAAFPGESKWIQDSNHRNRKGTGEKKYFHEPGGSSELSHYDARYFKGKVSYAEHRTTLQQLIRSYLTTLDGLGIDTWLAHGSLLGWWWNGRIMPWDYDLDVQVSVTTLYYLGLHFNRSTHEFIFDDAASPLSPATQNEGKPEGGNGTVLKKYLLDINPHHGDLTRGNGANVIDARWIDISNGMFIDITGLRERDPDTQPGVWSCKNSHRYGTLELWPLRRTQFEGVGAWIPYAFDKILTDEYGAKSLVTTEWAGHRWHPELKEWIPDQAPPAQLSEFQGHRTHRQQKTVQQDENVIVVYEEIVVEV
ncbi:LicD family-domain-containing protein [Xylariaceae sp. FL1272]|nr:LicD family-domain-containing protein [Xylariaceae sp. FL1272]